MNDKRAHLQPVIFSARNRRRKRKLTPRGYLVISYLLALLLLATLAIWILCRH
jgi:hypothetical protein